ncbi:MAG TPA: DUF6069 family protein [Actinomycetota bacterium]
MDTIERSSGAAARAAARPQRRRRLAAVGTAVALATATWVLIEPVAGVDLRAPGQGSPGFDIGLVAVILTAAGAALLGWGLLAAMERWTRRPRAWTWVALGGFLASLTGPMSGTGIPGSHRWLLALLHLVVAASLIPLMRRTIDG